MKISFVYHGSAGISGGYTSKFLESLCFNNKVYAFVNYNYIYKNRHKNLKLYKIFFPITDKYLYNAPRFRKIIRYCELFSAYLIILGFTVFLNFDKFIYNPITNLRLTSVFCRLVRSLVIEFIAVVHDATSHYLVNEKQRDSIFLLASTLIFHDKNSQNHLKNRIAKLTDSNLIVPFPWSLERFNTKINEIRTLDLLFIGHVRPSKGIDFLLKGYSKFKEVGGILELSISGKMASSQQIQALKYTNSVINKVLTDDEFILYLKSAKFIVLPYLQSYSNSSVHYCSVIHAGTPFICSDIELFQDFRDRIDCLKFKQGDIESFVSTLIFAQGLSEEERTQLAINSLQRMESKMLLFDHNISNYFSK